MNPITDAIKNIASGAGKGLLDGVKGVIGTFVADPTAKMQAEEKLKELEIAHEEKMAELANTLDTTVEQNLTDRAANDMKSDSWLSKNIRPMTLIFLTLAITVICILDSSKVFTVSASWLDLLKASYMAVLSFYFIGRTVEKGISIKNS